MVATLGIAVLGMVGVVAAPAQADDDTLTVDLLGTNDFHGRVATQPGAVEMAAAVEDERLKSPNTIFVGAGDNFGASTFTSSIANDIPTTDVFNAMGLDVSSVGNHEFDQGFDTLEARIAGIGDFEGHELDWDYLGANVYADGTTDAVLPAYSVETTASEVSIAFIGLVTEDTPSLVIPAGVEGLDFGSVTQAALDTIDVINDKEDVDAIVILTHDGGSSGDAVKDDSTNFGKFAQRMADTGEIAGIFSGHTHKSYEVAVDDMPIIQTGSYAANLGKMSFTFEVADDESLSLDSWETDLIPLRDFPIPENNTVVDNVKTVVSDAEVEAEEKGSREVGKVSADLNRAAHQRAESTISNLIADAQLEAINDQGATDDLPVIAFTNPGGVRSSIPYAGDGTVTYRQVADAQPFANTLEAFDLTGSQIMQVLEEQWPPAEASRGFLRLGVAGLTYFYDTQASDGEHITHVTIGEDDGAQELDEDATYRVVANSFLASGGDDFVTFRESTNAAGTGLIDTDALVEYFDERDVVDPDYRQRAVGTHWITSQDDVYQPGDGLELDLSSLIFSTNEPKPEELSIELANAATGESFEFEPVPVDTTIDDAIDDIGRVEIRVTVPEIDELASEPEMWQLLAADEVNGYALWFDLQLAGEDVEAPPTEEPTEEPTTPPTEEPTSPAPPTEEPTSSAPGGDLPETGAEVTGPLAGGALLLALGGLLVALRRRNGSLV